MTPAFPKATAKLSSGSAPGRQMARNQSALPSSSPRCTAGTRPARASDDLPLPDEPTIARKRPSGREPGGRRSALSNH
jgi:hypothetical protein